MKKSLVENIELKTEYETNATSRKVFDLATRLEGTIRSHGVACRRSGNRQKSWLKYAPLEMAQKGVVATQYAMGPIEDIGLLKMDFLGLSNLTIIKNATRIIRKVYGKDIDMSLVPLDDKKTTSYCSGVKQRRIQLESSGMKRYLKELKPTVFEDIVAMVPSIDRVLYLQGLPIGL